MSLWTVLLAGGRGERLRQEVNKVYLPIAGKEMIEYSLDTFDRSEAVAGLVVVARSDDEAHVAALLEEFGVSKPTRVVAGGLTRHRSEHNGIEALAEDIEAGEVDWVAVHDGARPFVTLDLLDSVVAEAVRHGGAVPALSVASPLYERRGDRVVPLPTESIRRAQTPQVFAAGPLLSAYRRAQEEGFEGVDTAETVERFSDLEIGLVAGDPNNVKVTFVEDLLEAEDLARGFREGRWVADAQAW